MSGKSSLTQALQALADGQAPSAFAFNEVHNPDELHGHAYDVVLQVVDATRLEESLMLTPHIIDEQEKIAPYYSYQNSSYFDEIYHARTAYEHIQNIYPYEVSHPPLGKVLMGVGIRIFGMVPFGWRFMGTLAGELLRSTAPSGSRTTLILAGAGAAALGSVF